MALSDTVIRNLKPKKKPYKLGEGGGLYIVITPSGGKLWRFKYRVSRPPDPDNPKKKQKEKTLSLGSYPAVSLKAARALRDKAKEDLAAGFDPSELKRQQRERAAALAADSFEKVAREWFDSHLAQRSKGHRDKVVRRLEREVFPYIGRRPIAEVTAPDILLVVQRVEKRGRLETARRTLQNIGQVFQYAVRTARTNNNPASALRGALAPVTPRHMAAPTEPEKVGELLRAIEAFNGGPVVAAALQLLPLFFVRPGELRTMRWEDLNLDAAEWRFVTSKTGTDHLVALSTHAVAILRDLHPLTGHLPGGWVFPGGRNPLRPMSDGAINSAYKRMYIDTREELTGHGWRAVARTLLHERLGYRPEVIEHQLAHSVPDTLGRAYNRTKFIEERREMMQVWADYLDELRKGAAEKTGTAD